MTSLKASVPYICKSPEAAKALADLKEKSFSRLGVKLELGAEDIVEIKPLAQLVTGDLVFSCANITVFVAPSFYEKIGGLDIDYVDGSFITDKNNFKKPVLKVEETTKKKAKSVKKAGASSSSKKNKS